MFHKDEAFTGRTLVSNNVIYNSGGGGVHIFKSSNVVVVNNTTFNNALPNLADPSVRDVTYTGTTLHIGAAGAGPYATYTTALGTKTGGSLLNYGQIDTPASDNVVIHNNILWAGSGRKINDSMGANTNVTYTNNLFGRFGGFTSTDKNNGAYWDLNAAAFTANLLLGTATVDSIFANSTDSSLPSFLRLKTTATISPAINAGALNSNTLLEDRAGTARPIGTAPDMGAYEEL